MACIAICLATLAALAGVSAIKTQVDNNIVYTHQKQPTPEGGGACASLKASGIDVSATERASGGVGKGQRAAAAGDPPAACLVQFSLRAPAAKPAVSFTGACVVTPAARLYPPIARSLLAAVDNGARVG